MESDSLKTASAYINNQLLSRGLLRDGQAIEFARPDKGDGGVGVTMGRVMSVINDLILRRDRDSSQREALSSTIRVLRADALRQTSDIERLTNKNAECARKLGIAEASERALKLQLKSAEQAARGLKEEMARMKVLVQQTRAQCANEVRKREKVIEGLKRHVGEGGRPRGSGKAVGVISVTVVPGVGEEKDKNAMSVQEEGYDLRSETNEFLTELARGLSEENENVAGLLRRTVETLRTLSGCEKSDAQLRHDSGVVVNFDRAYESLAGEMEEVIEHLRTLLTNPSFVPIEEVEVREEEIIRLREGWEKMESRWKEAVQMMDGWRRRMARSGQTVNLEELRMGILLSPLKAGEEFQGGQDRMQLSTLMEEGEDDTQADIDAMSDEEQDDGRPPPDPAEFMEEEEDFDESESSIFEHYPADDITPEGEVENVEEEAHTLNTDSSGSPGPAPQLSPLKETTGNASRPLYPNGPQKDSFTTIVEENTMDLLELDTSSPQKSARIAKGTPTPAQPKAQNSSLSSIAAEDEVSLLKTSATSSTNQTTTSHPQIASPQKKTSSRSAPLPSTTRREPSSTHKPLRPVTLDPPTSRITKPAATPRLRAADASSRLPRPQNERNPPPPQQSPLTMATIAAKLAATEREADAARVRAKLKAARMNRIKTASAGSSTSNTTTTTTTTVPVKSGQEVVEKRIANTSSGMDNEVVNNDEDGGEALLDVEKSGRKRKAGRTQGGRANRRRSTLSPWEMESLILGGLGGSGGGSPSKDG